MVIARQSGFVQGEEAIVILSMLKYNYWVVYNAVSTYKAIEEVGEEKTYYCKALKYGLE